MVARARTAAVRVISLRRRSSSTRSTWRAGGRVGAALGGGRRRGGNYEGGERALLCDSRLGDAACVSVPGGRPEAAEGQG